MAPSTRFWVSNSTRHRCATLFAYGSSIGVRGTAIAYDAAAMSSTEIAYGDTAMCSVCNTERAYGDTAMCSVCSTVCSTERAYGDTASFFAFNSIDDGEGEVARYPSLVLHFA
eukprot:1496904-Rhodomonas_salina.2